MKVREEQPPGAEKERLFAALHAAEDVLGDGTRCVLIAINDRPNGEHAMKWASKFCVREITGLFRTWLGFYDRTH